MAGSPDFPMEEVLAGVKLQRMTKALRKVDDEFEGVIVEVTEGMEYEDFACSLKYSLAQWRRQGKKGVWIKVPIELVHLAEAAVKEGFWFHHAERNYLMLVYNIPGGENTLPGNASHRVSVGSFVMNEKGELLVVQEKNGSFRGWKFPTGVVEEGESILDAAVREVTEETAIKTEFIDVLAFRHTLNAFFSKSNIMFVCMLRPLSCEIKVQELEIQAAKWMAWEEYIKQPYVQNCQFQKHICNLFLSKTDGTYTGFTPRPHLNDYIFFNTHHLNCCTYPPLQFPS